MLRSVKYGLYGAVLAGMVAGTAAWQGVDKTVHLVVDGSPTTVHTTAGRVSGALADAGFKVGPHDIVAPAPTASVHSGSRVVLNRGRLLRLDVDGVHKDVWTTAPTVADALAQLGYSTSAFTSVSRSRRLPLSPTDIDIRTPRLVTVVHDGTKDRVATTDETVRQLLADLGVKVGAKDRVSPSPSAPVRAGMTVTVQHIGGRQQVVSKVLPYATKQQPTAALPSGTTKIVTPGRNGLAQLTYALVYIDGKLAGRTLVRTDVVTPPVTQVVQVGTGAARAAAAQGGPMAVDPGSAQAIAQRMVAARGWGNDQFSCLVSLWDKESGWRVNAANPSGAYGIPQALPGSKMASAGSDWQTNPATQITWGLGYIAGTYGTPCAAWGHSQQYNWY